MARRSPRPANVNRHGIRIARGDRDHATPTCRRKDVYRSREQAEGYAVFFRSGLGRLPTLRPYWCAGCGGWHLTKSAGTV